MVKPSSPIIPTLAQPFTVLYTDDACYCGLLCHKLFRSVGGELSKEELIICAKALSDNSKAGRQVILQAFKIWSAEVFIGHGPAIAVKAFAQGSPIRQKHEYNFHTFLAAFHFTDNAI